MNLSAQLEYKYLDRCKNLVENKLKWEESAHWTQRDYEYLCELIEEKTGTRLSLSTVKRIWKNDYNKIPHPATLNALAGFVEYKNWHEFKQKNPPEQPTIVRNLYAKKDIASKKRFHRNKLLLLLISALFVVAAILYIVLTKNEKAIIDQANVSFSSKKNVSIGLPNTVIFKYDVKNSGAEQFSIQQSWDTSMRANIPKNGEYHTSIYYYPGYHKAKLIADEQIVKQLPLHITTDGWLTIFRYGIMDEIPVYIDHPELVKDGMLHASTNILVENNANITGDYLVSYYNVRDFGKISGDDFTLISELKNGNNQGGLLCQYCYVTLMCENGRTFVPLCAPGCVSNINLKFIDTFLSGKTNDLSPFGCNLNSWQTLNIVVDKKNAQIKLNDKVIFKVSFSAESGRIIFIHCTLLTFYFLILLNSSYTAH